MEETAKKATRLLSPKIDSVFQVLFGEVGSEFITKELLEAILGRIIRSNSRRRNFRCRFK